MLRRLVLLWMAEVFRVRSSGAPVPATSWWSEF